ncbi:MAG TPA: hypothetical protein DCY88_13485 [Cyanobacteria bacterium UBA11372]|nr:hypothetical protein [Cyanobacteria bacterium UBA11372]
MGQRSPLFFLTTDAKSPSPLYFGRFRVPVKKLLKQKSGRAVLMFIGGKNFIKNFFPWVWGSWRSSQILKIW